MEARNLKYIKNNIDCEINHKIYGWIPFTAKKDDLEPLAKQVYINAVNGEYGDIEPDTTDYEALQLELKNQEKINEAKQYLTDTDWVVVKINEASVQGDDIQPLLTKYADILSERENKRLTINQLEG